MKNISSNGLEILLKLINISLVEGLPNQWKTATITMIPKKEKMSTSPLDYRPISLLSCIGKLAERVVKNRLYWILERNNLIFKEQSDFRYKIGTTDNLIFITQKIQECLNRKKNNLWNFF